MLIRRCVYRIDYQVPIVYFFYSGMIAAGQGFQPYKHGFNYLLTNKRTSKNKIALLTHQEYLMPIVFSIFYIFSNAICKLINYNFLNYQNSIIIFSYISVVNTFFNIFTDKSVISETAVNCLL